MSCTNNYSVGDRIESLLVMERIGSDRWGNPLWKCLCDCGNEKIIRSSSLISGTKSCGCYQKKHRFGGFGEIPKSYWSSVERCAKKRNLSVDITIEDGWNLFLAQDRKCAITSIPLTFKSENKSAFGTASLDRIDSSLPYVSGNVWWIHKHINIMKLDFKINEFVELCQQVSNNIESIKKNVKNFHLVES